jgi:hypothetical protein
MCTRIQNVFSENEILSLLTLPEVLAAKEKLTSNQSGVEYFSVDLSSSLKSILLEKLGLDVTTKSSIPMRWIRGDTRPHIDKGVRDFEKTYLLYLTNSEGEFRIDGDSFPITQGTAYIFPEGLPHETIETGTEPRLLLGPMSEEGIPVGGFAIYGAGGTTIYIRQVGSDIRYSSDPNALDGPIISWPCAVENTDTAAGTLTIIFSTDITLNNDDTLGTNKYFYCISDEIQFGNQYLNDDGSRPIITIDGITNYPGLVQNGSFSSNGKNFIRIKNLHIHAINGSETTLQGGWVAQEYFSKGSESSIANCSSDGPILAGGIAGNSVGNDGGSVIISGCYSTGDQINFGAGGIVGFYPGYIGGIISITQCWSSGLIFIEGGGIVGDSIDSTSVTIANCYSTGAIGESGGGIVGQNAGIGGDGETTLNINNCYSTGAIGDNAGGICGKLAGVNAIVDNCYSLGTIGTGGGAIFGASSTGTDTNCYSTNGGAWSDSAANSSLADTPVTTNYGFNWSRVNGLNTPYILSTSYYSPYTLQLIRAYDSSIVKGTSTSGGVVPGYTYSLLEINNDLPSSFPFISIDSSTGVLSTTSSSEAGLYNMYIYSTKNPYSITQYFLTITSGGGGDVTPAEEVPCCEKPLYLSNTTDYTTRNKFAEGNTLIGSTAIRRAPMSYTDLLYKKMAYAAKR